ncbi:Hypothetical protein R9X50_00124400 [Acrodontium crateriforme]|uniref:Mediator of RNA polymerase II transcription subunit 10 n=1 Tax=Acrodontium crateriforme TaxID=150365 RepID=A0AAQ3R7Y0_9PEZI|nr:Hypothetical protein R9X50_00124400 [Acrodontium crateriforme]
MAATTLDDVDVQLRAIISNLYLLIVQAHDHQGPGTQQVMTTEIKRLLENLIRLSQSAQRLPVYLPLDIIEYVEASRNPDIYTREFVELVMKQNQQLKGRSEAFADFRDIFAREIMGAIPDIKHDVKQIAEASGGKVEV